MISTERRVVNPVNIFIVRTSLWQMPTVYFSPYLLNEKKRSKTSSKLVSKVEFCCTELLCGCCKTCFYDSHSLISIFTATNWTRDKLKAAVVAQFQIWKNFASESDVTSVLCSIPGNMSVYEQTRVLLLHLPTPQCIVKKMNVTLVSSTFNISLRFIAVEVIHSYSIIAIFPIKDFFITTEQSSI